MLISEPAKRSDHGVGIFLGFDWPGWPERAFSWLATASVRAMP